MAIEERFVAVISARNQASAVLRQVGAQFAALSRQAGLTRLAAATAGVGQALGNVAMRAGSVAAPIAAIGVAAAGAGIVSLARGAAAAGDDLGDLSERTGASVRDLQAWGDAAQRAGSSPEDLANSLGKLNNNVRDAATGGNAELANLFGRLGISMRDANGNIRSAADLMPQLADGFARNEDPTLRTAMAMALFGRAGTSLIPMLAAGSSELREQGDRWRQYGFDFTNVLDSMKTAQNQFDNMDSSVRGLGQAIGAELAPILGPLAQRIADWVAVNRELIATRVGEWVQKASTAIQSFFADRGPIERLSEFGTMIGNAIEWMGGIQNVFIAFGALAALPFIAAIVSIGASLIPLGAALGKLALALGAGSPIGIAVIAFGALAAVVISNWKPIEEFFVGLWASITTAFTAAWDKIKPIIDLITGAVSSITNLLPTTGPVSALVTGTSPTGPVAAPDAQAQRRANQRAAGARPILDFNDNVLPQPAQAAAAAAAPAQQGRVTVDVNINGLPPGSRAEASSSGGLVQAPTTSVGYAFGRAPR